MIPRDHHNLIINTSIVVDEKVNNLGHEDLLLAECSRKWGYVSGILSLRGGSGRVCRLFEDIYCTNINSECAHGVSCLVDSAASPMN